ncbi:PL29 family lyase N-terminal domain-containing protein [Bacteroides sp. GM023]|uniref:PL29 family lyase N-terminal domain-containing protein n=1 Tax=Bacteroides sp. GM023 TaxID=2723058 RepID=UPI00168B45E1|nr:PL29 family lyase N-terminal domain-containing protein [Bacteroides sp. GM023]MBD3587778.1 hypothetical protein [Bacteroides sp. GM023]
MKRKFVKVMFFGALALSTVTYVGCKDYDDDIDNLQTQIDANKASIAELQNFVKEGKWVTNVEPITDGFKITFNDNKSYSITSGKDATPTTIKIDPTTKNWIINGTDLGICAEGKKGTDGKPGGEGKPGESGAAGYAPQISEDGYWMVWDAETEKPKKTDVKAATDIYVTADADNPLVWVLNILNKETKEWEKVSMPKSARITSMSVLGVKEDGTVDVSSAEAEATLYYGIVKTKAIEFPKGTKYAVDDVLVARGGSKIHALINPADLKAADIQAYEIGLTDSKGNTNFVVANIADNFSLDALTRTADPKKEPTANKGVYDLTLKFANGLTKDELTALETAETAYALTTKDAWGNEIISGYDVKVKVEQGAPDVDFQVPDEKLTYQKSYSLDELFSSELDKVVAHYYTVAENDKVEFDKKNNTIIAKEPTKVKVTIHYLAVDGTIVDNVEVELTFTYVAKKAEIKDMTWVVSGDKKQLTATSEIVGPSVEDIIKNVNLSAPIEASIAYTDDKAMINGAPVRNYVDKSIELELLGLGKDGNPVDNWNTNTDKVTKFVIKATFNFETVAAVPHTATVKFKNSKPGDNLGNEYLYETTFKITVDQQDDKLFVFKRATAYFDKDGNAKAYGTVPTIDNNKISFDLYTLYKEGSISDADKDSKYISFTEEKPSRVESGKKVYASAWLTEEEGDVPTHDSKIKVFPYVSKPAADKNWGGAYTDRYITVSYAPFGNDGLKAITDRINLTIQSEIYEGTFEFIKEVEEKAIGTKENPFVIAGNTVTISPDDFKRIDARAKTYDFDDERIESVETKLADEDAQTYLEMTGKLISDPATPAADDDADKAEVVISKKEGAVIQIPPTCKVNVNILDKWGRTKSVSIYVTVNK